MNSLEILRKAEWLLQRAQGQEAPSVEAIDLTEARVATQVASGSSRHAFEDRAMDHKIRMREQNDEPVEDTRPSKRKRVQNEEYDSPRSSVNPSPPWVALPLPASSMSPVDCPRDTPWSPSPSASLFGDSHSEGGEPDASETMQNLKSPPSPALLENIANEAHQSSPHPIGTCTSELPALASQSLPSPAPPRKYGSSPSKQSSSRRKKRFSDHGTTRLRMEPRLKRQHGSTTVSILLVPGPSPRNQPNADSEWSNLESVSVGIVEKVGKMGAFQGFMHDEDDSETEHGVKSIYSHFMLSIGLFLNANPHVKLYVAQWDPFVDIVVRTPERINMFSCVMVRGVRDETHKDWARFYNEMVTLAADGKTFLFPDLQEIGWAERKIDVLRLLEKVAKDDTHTGRPKTLTMRTLKNVSGDDDDKDAFILKREGTHLGTGIIYPLDWDAAVQWEEDHRGQQKSGKKPYRWMKQEYVPLMEKTPEWRVFLVDGKVVSILAESKEEYSALEGWTLDALTNLLEDGLEVVNFSRLSPKMDTIRKARNELAEFSETALDALVKYEENSNGRRPSIARLCRFDVALYMDGKVDYWINGVARGSEVFIHADSEALKKCGEAMVNMVGKGAGTKYSSMKPEEMKGVERFFFDV